MRAKKGSPYNTNCMDAQDLSRSEDLIEADRLGTLRIVR